MPRARLTVTLPDSAWLGAVSRTHPSTRFRVSSVFPGSESVGLLTIDAGEELPAVVAALDDHPAVRSLSVLTRDADRVVCQFTADTDRLALLSDVGVPVVYPVTVRDGRMHLELHADATRFAALADRFDAVGVEYIVDAVEPLDTPEMRLTPRQRQVLRLAVERGFYETPRACELRELAAELDIAPSTCSETLRRATEAVLERYVATGDVEGE